MRWARRSAGARTIAAAAAAFAALLAAGALASSACASFSAAAEPVAPKLSNVAQSAQSWREGSGLAVITSAPLGTTFSLTLNEAAHVTLTFIPSFSGRRVCTVHLHGATAVRRCRRVFAVGTLGFQGHAGANHVRFFGRLSSTAKLAPASYRLTITARNAVGAAEPAVLHFTIVR